MAATYTGVRRPEHMHTKKCMAAALIAAIENARDPGPCTYTDIEFHSLCQSGELVQWAYMYLNEGTMPCECPPCGCCTN